MENITLNEYFEKFFNFYKEKYEEKNEKELRIIIDYDTNYKELSNHKTLSCKLDGNAYKIIKQQQELIQISFQNIFESIIMKMIEQTDKIYFIKDIYFEADKFMYEYKIICECLEFDDYIKNIVVKWG